jgi:hypothetical protein
MCSLSNGASSPAVATPFNGRILSIMPISNECIDEFIPLYEKACGEKLSRDEARIRAGQLITLYRLLMQPLPEHQESPIQTY